MSKYDYLRENAYHMDDESLDAYFGDYPEKIEILKKKLEVATTYKEMLYEIEFIFNEETKFSELHRGILEAAIEQQTLEMQEWPPYYFTIFKAEPTIFYS